MFVLNRLLCRARADRCAPAAPRTLTLTRTLTRTRTLTPCPPSVQVLLNPKHAAARQLAYNTPDDFDALRARALSASQRKREARKRKRLAPPA